MIRSENEVKTDESFLQSIQALPKIDTHEHYPSEVHLLRRSYDFFDFLTPYICDSLESAGMSPDRWKKIMNKDRPFQERWDLFSPYLEDIRHTSYFRAIHRTWMDDYDLKSLSAQEAARISLRIKEETKEGFLAGILKKNHIHHVQTFLPWNLCAAGTDSKMSPIPTVSDLSEPSKEQFAALADFTGVPIHSCDGLRTALTRLMEKYAQEGYQAIKFGTGYRRTLDFSFVTPHEASKAFDDLISSDCPSKASVRCLEDFITDHLLSEAGSLRFAVYFHTGIHAWNKSSPAYTHARELESLIKRHPEVRFILLHAGMPYTQEAVLLTRYYPNVHLNLTWCYLIDYAASVNLLRQCLDTLPVSKVSAFGGDYTDPRQVTGHLRMAEEAIAQVLWEAVRHKRMTRQEALDVAKRWFYDNPCRFLERNNK